MYNRKYISIDEKVSTLFKCGKKHIDNRGEFYELYSPNMEINFNTIQLNTSISYKKFTFRGMHYQINPHAQAKIISVLSGIIIDFIMDLKTDIFNYYYMSPGDTLFVPRGYAHGFMTLEDNTQVVYQVDNVYNKESERCINPFTIPNLNCFLQSKDIIISDKDKNGLIYGEHK